MLSKEFLEYVETFITKMSPNKRKTRITVSYCLEKIVKVLSHGYSWCHLDCTCHFTSIYKRFRNWINNGIFESLWNQLTESYCSDSLKKDASCFKILFIDSTMIKNINGSDMLGRNHFDRNRLATKMSVVCDQNKVPLSATFYQANNHDASTIESSLEAIPFKIHRNKKYHSILVGDKGYISKKEKKDHLKNTYRITLVTPFRKNQKGSLSSKESSFLKDRFKIEHLFCRLDKFARLRFRYERHIDTYKALNFIAMSSITFSKLF